MRWIEGVMWMAWVMTASCDRRPEAPLLHPTESTAMAAGSNAGNESNSSSPSKGATGSSAMHKARSRCMVPLPATSAAKPPPAKACPTDPVFGGVTLKKAKVSFPDAEGKPTLDVELALAPAERQRGLMFRTHMDENAGMLFHFPGAERVQSFWMHNTCIPLDMLFINGDGFIAGIQENIPTLNDASRSIPCPVRYVLEVNAGWCRAHGVKPGQTVRLPALKP